MFEHLHVNILPARQIDVLHLSRCGWRVKLKELDACADVTPSIAQTATRPFCDNSSFVASTGTTSEAAAHELLPRKQLMPAYSNPDADAILVVDSIGFKRSTPDRISRIRDFDIFASNFPSPEPAVDLCRPANVCAMAAGPLASKDLIL